MSSPFPVSPRHVGSLRLRRLRAGGIIAGALLLAACATPGHAPHWSYNGADGPEKWSELDTSFAACKQSREQAPIDIRTADVQKAALPPLVFNYPAGAASVINNGHTIQVNPPPGGVLKIDGDTYELLQFHFHTPSEEAIDGRVYPMVAHIVHKDAQGKLAVVGVLMVEGRENAALAPVFAALPAKEGGQASLPLLDTAAMLPAQQGYFAFAGSLTTPPCSDGVRWQVLQTPVEISPQQLAVFRSVFAMNARPLQPLNGRVVRASQ